MENLRIRLDLVALRSILEPKITWRVVTEEAQRSGCDCCHQVMQTSVAL